MLKKIKCIKRMIELNMFVEITDWLIENKFTDKLSIDVLNRDQERAELIYVALKQAEKDDKIQLLDFTWQLLPLEQIKILCVTDKEERTFEYGY